MSKGHKSSSKRTHEAKDYREGLGVQEKARYLKILQFIFTARHQARRRPGSRHLGGTPYNSKARENSKLLQFPWLHSVQQQSTRKW
ncbi:uncharacterized protein V6R79_000525 [Siganus canaliculatus]